MIAILCLGCFVSVRESFTENALERAAFDLDCPKEKIEILALNGGLDDEMRSGKSVGVKGCGGRAVYLYVYQQGWVLNSDGKQDGAGGAPPTPSASGSAPEAPKSE